MRSTGSTASGTASGSYCASDCDVVAGAAIPPASDAVRAASASPEFILKDLATALVGSADAFTFERAPQLAQVRLCKRRSGCRDPTSGTPRRGGVLWIRGSFA